MKKIIELAEKYISDSDRLNGSSSLADVAKVSMEYDRLKEAITLHKTLNQTPITEEWLKEHGWEKNNRNLWWKACNGEKGIFTLFVRVSTFNKWYWYVNGNDYLCLTSIADLYDACDLCGIKID